VGLLCVSTYVVALPHPGLSVFRPYVASLSLACECAVPEAPIDFILDGILPSGEEIGLRRIDGYLVRVLELDAAEFGCAQRRPRIYIIGLETEDESILAP
jgi:hypothetical protein